MVMCNVWMLSVHCLIWKIVIYRVNKTKNIFVRGPEIRHGVR